MIIQKALMPAMTFNIGIARAKCVDLVGVVGVTPEPLPGCRFLTVAIVLLPAILHPTQAIAESLCMRLA